MKRHFRMQALAIAAAAVIVLSGCSGTGTGGATVDAASRAATVAAAEKGANVLLTAAAQDNEWTGPSDSPAPIDGLEVTVIPEQMASTASRLAAETIRDQGALIGWDVKISDGQGKPDVQLNAVNTAVDEGADAIILIFVDTTRVQAGVQRAVDGDIPIITIGSLKNTPDTVPDVSFDWYGSGQAIAQYMVWKSDAELNLLQMKNTDLYVVVNGQFAGSQDWIEDNCASCTVTVKEWSLASFDDPTSGPAAQASAALQSDTSIDWVSCFDSCLFRVSQAVDRTGMTERMSGAGYDCSPENLAQISEGGMQKVCFADPRAWLAMAAMDNINRMSNDEEPFDYTKSIPVALFDKDVLDGLDASKREELETTGWQGNFDFRAKFLELWGVEG